MVSRSHCKHHLASPEHRSHLRDLSDLWCQLDHFDVGNNVNIIITFTIVIITMTMVLIVPDVNWVGLDLLKVGNNVKILNLDSLFPGFRVLWCRKCCEYMCKELTTKWYFCISLKTQNHKYTNTWLPLWMWENRCRKHQNWLLPTHFRSCQERTWNG